MGSSLVARQAHNLKVGGSNPSPATNHFSYALIIINKIFKYHLLFLKN